VPAALAPPTTRKDFAVTDHTNTATRYLTSLNRHARKHGLGNTISAINVPQWEHAKPYLQVYPYVDAGHVATLVRWLPTLTDPVVRVTCSDLRNLHLHATGAMDDGTVTGVAALLHDTDRELVEVNAVTTVGAVIPVELLLSLVSATADESRTDDTLAGMS